MDHFNQIIRLILKNSRLLVILPFLAMVGLWHLTKDTPQKYEVKSRFLYDFDDGESTSVSGESMSQQEIYTEFLNTLEIIKSKKLAEKLRSKIAYESLNELSDAFPFGWPKDIKQEIAVTLEDILEDKRSPYLNKADSGKVSKTIDAFYEYHKLSAVGIQEAMKARRLHSSDFLEIEMSHTSNKQVYYMCLVFNDLMIKEIENINKRNIGKQKAVIAELVRKAKADLDGKVDELEKLKVNNNIINLAEHTKSIVTYQVQLEQMKANLKQQIASNNRATETLKEGLDKEQFVGTTREENQSILSHKNEMYEAQDVKLVHLQEEIDFAKIIKQQEVINRNYEGIKRNLDKISMSAVYDPTAVHTDMTMQFIDFSVKRERLEDELVEVEREIDRVKRYAAYFAPFESAISTLRDEITIAQKTYLLFLNKLNITESLEVGATRNKLELVDHPEFPQNPLPSKTKLVIVAGGVVVFILLVTFIIINYLLDSRIKDVKTFERRIHPSVVAALPKFPKKQRDPIQKKALEMIHKEGIKKVVREVGDRKSIAINNLTSYDDCKNVVDGLKKFWRKEKVKVLTLDGDMNQIMNAIDKALEKFDRLICISSPLQFSNDGLSVAECTECSFLHFQLGRVKSGVDERVLKNYDKVVRDHKGFILTDLTPEYMDSYIGDLPKRRNKLRLIIKKIINRDFSWKY